MPRRSRTRSRTRSRSRSRTHSNEPEQYRLHIGDLSEKVTTDEVEKAFSKFGLLDDVWMAKNPPCFGFVVFKHKKDAEEALSELDGRNIGGSRVRVTWARPRTKGRRRGFDPNMRCYQCGGRGHFSRDCDGKSGGSKNTSSRRRYSRSRSRSRSRGRSGYDRRRRSRSRSYNRSRSLSSRRH